MKKIFFWSFVFLNLFAFSQNITQNSTINNQGELDYSEDDFIVLLETEAIKNADLSSTRTQKDVIGIQSFDALSKKFNISSVEYCFKQNFKFPLKAKSLNLDRYVLVKVTAGSDLKSIMAQYQGLPEVELTEYNYISRAHTPPNDPLYTEQWGLKNTSNAKEYGTSNLVGTPGSDINIEPAWNLHTGTTNPVTIAILDTGIDYNHPEFNGRMLPGYDFMNNDDDPMDEDFDGHGTSCAGIAAAAGDNGIGVAGVNWGANILPVKVLHNSSGTNSAVANGIIYAVNNGADVISMSLGSGFPSSLVADAVNYAYDANVLVFASRGNGNDTADNYPSSFSTVISVGGLSPCNTRKTPTSCDGEFWWGASYGGGPDKMDFVAPAARITTTDITGFGGYSANEYTDSFNGTSSACPFAAGVGALIKSYNPDLSVDEIRDIMRNTAVDIDAPGYDDETGYGRIDAEAALLAAIPNDFWFLGQDSADFDVCNTNDTTSIDFDFFRLPTAGSEDVTLSLVGAPTGIGAQFTPSIVTSETMFSLELSGISTLNAGTYNLTISGQSTSFTYDLPVSLNVYDSLSEDVNLTFPLDGQNSLEIPFSFQWETLINANLYQLQVALDLGFSNIVDDVTTSENQFTSVSISDGNEYFWRVRPLNDCGEGNYSAINSFITACNNTAELELNFASTTELTLEVINSSASTWEIEYVPAGNSPTGIGTIFTSTIANFDALNTDTCYDFYIKSECEFGFSNWNGPYQFCTSPDYCNGDLFYDSGGPDGNYSNNEFNITTIYPSAGFNTITVDFLSFQTENCCDYLRIFDGDDIDAPFIGEFRGTNSPGTITSDNPTGALTFLFSSDFSVTRSGWEALVSCEFISCPEPDNLQVSSVSLSTAELSWDVGNAETQWEIEYGVSGFTQGTGTVIQTSDNPFTLTELDLSTAYDVYLRATCGENPEDDDSAWIGPEGFTTAGLSSPINLTAEINQENGEVILNWDEGSAGITEDFTDGVANNWIPITGSWNVSDETYKVNSTLDNISSSYYNQDFNAFEVETQIRKNSGDSFNVGLYFNGDENDIDATGEWKNTYAFMISANGNWLLVRIEDGAFIALNDGWTFSPDINQGLGSWNTLKINYADGYMDAYINDVLQGTFYDTTFTSGKIGIKMYDSGTGSAELDYININYIGTTGYDFAAVNQPASRNVYYSQECINSNTCQDTDVIGNVLSPTPQIQSYSYLGVVATEDFLNYNLYRDGILLDTPTEATYTDMLTSYGTYDYQVTAVYNQGESDPSNIATVIYQGVPDISVNPTSLEETLPEGGMSTQVLTISNSGDGPLDFNISSTLIDGLGYGDPVVTTVGDDTTYTVDNVLSDEIYSPGYSKLIRSYAFSTDQNILILRDNSQTNEYETALINLNLPYTLVTNWSVFNNELTEGTNWDMVIVNSYDNSGDASSYTALNEYLNNDGLLLFAHWNLDNFSTHPLLNSMGVNFVQTFFNPLSISPVNGSNTIFNIPNSIPDLVPTADQANADGQIVNVISGAEQVAYFEGNSSSGAIVINQNGNSIFNGFQSSNFQADENSNGKQDIVELIENEITYLLGVNWLSANPTTGTVASGSSVDIDITFDATNLTAGLYEATLDIASNDPDEPIVTVPVELTVLPPSCPEPTNFVVSDILSNSSELSWDAGDEETQWEIEYGETGFTQGGGTIVQVNTNSYSLTGLNSMTTYDVYLRANCGESPGDDDSTWVGPINFTTPLDYCNGDRFYDSGGPTGNYSNNENIVTTIYPSAGFNTVTVDFISFQTESCCDELRIYDGEDTNAPFIGEYQGSNSPGTLTSTSSSGALTFLFTSDGSVTRSGWEASVTCEFISCPEPTNLLVLNVAQTSADINWDEGSTETQWQIEYGLTGFSQGNGTIVQADTNPYTLIGLSPSTAYDVYLRANCGANPDDNDSNWVGPLNFTTTCAVYVAPMYEHFSDFSTPGCWEEDGSENWIFSLGASFDAATAGDHTEGQSTNYAWIDGSAPNGIDHNSHLRTMEIDVSQLSSPALQFSVFSVNTIDFTYNTLRVTVSNDVDDIFNVLTLQGSTDNWSTYTIDLSGITLNSDLITVNFSIEENSSGNSSYNDILIDDVIIDEIDVLNVEEFDSDALTYFPNPFNDVLHINYSKNIDSVEIFNVLGQNLKTVKTNNRNVEIDMTLLNPGTYILKVYSETSYQVIKVIKK